MKHVMLLGFAILLTSFDVTIAQTTKPSVKEGIRPVFYPASSLAAICQDWSDVFYAHGHALTNAETVDASTEKIMHAMNCQMYILGFQDGKMERVFGSHYRPLSSHITEMKPLIDTFLKYVKDHPEQGDFAASTLLLESEKIVVKVEKSK